MLIFIKDWALHGFAMHDAGIIDREGMSGVCCVCVKLVIVEIMRLISLRAHLHEQKPQIIV